MNPGARATNDANAGMLVKCRHCNAPLETQLIDLGSAPPSNAYLTELTMRRPEKWFPLRVLICEQCWLVQTEDYSRASELFNEEYAYFSSFSDSWVRHGAQFVEKAIQQFGLNNESLVVELGSNDGWLLQEVKRRGVQCLGIEPTASTANAARQKGIPVIEKFFGQKLAMKLRNDGQHADLVVGINVLAHVPDINDFVSGVTTLLTKKGVCTFEFPHLLNLIEQLQFDTIYHEHFSYLSFESVRSILAKNGLTVFDVETLGTHGGSLRVYSQRTTDGDRSVSNSVRELINVEQRAGMKSKRFYANFAPRVEEIKIGLLRELLVAKSQGKKIAAYGAAAKGNTLLNYVGIRSDIVSFVSDRNTSKQGKWMPGSRIPIVSEEYLRNARPDVVLILPWNLHDEIVSQLEYVREWGGQFLLVQPSVRLI